MNLISSMKAAFVKESRELSTDRRAAAQGDRAASACWMAGRRTARAQVPAAGRSEKLRNTSTVAW